MKLLVVEDDLDLGDGIRIALSEQGVDVLWVRRLEQAMAALDDDSLDMVLLDLGLPDGDGLSLLLRIRQAPRRLPAIILSARDTLQDRLRGLDEGADDYLVKPFALAELQSRVRALARRSGLGEHDGLRLRGLVLHEPTRQASLDGLPVSLSRSEFDLLALLMKRLGRVQTRRALEEHALRGASGNDSNTLDVHMSNLRRKIGPGYIRTVRGIGYVIDTGIDVQGIV